MQALDAEWEFELLPQPVYLQGLNGVRRLGSGAACSQRHEPKEDRSK
ncbi:MAG: hypothetical protein KDI71_23385 [Xanthomonadales bacterium]|nr:hypothetical protein [Xanthomonadales bacterium]